MVMETPTGRAVAIDRAQSHLRDGGYERDLAKLVSFRTVSQRPHCRPDLKRYIDAAIVPDLRALGFETIVYQNPFQGHGPVLLATRFEDAGLPTVLGYGHGDVVPGLEGQWSNGRDPWQLTREGDRLYGRGTADNKGQYAINLAALRVVLEERGRLGFNAKLLIEMGEENGSRGLREIVMDNLDAFKCDVFIGSDGTRHQIDRPCVQLGCRGLFDFDLSVELRSSGFHPGVWGGLISSASIVLSHAIATIVGPRGEIRVPEMRPPAIAPAVRDALSQLQMTCEAGTPKIELDWGEPGLSPSERVYAWNSFEVMAMEVGDFGAYARLIPAKARAHCQLRFVVGTNTDAILPGLRRHLDDNGFPSVEISTPADGTGFYKASQTDPDNPWVSFVRCSMLRTNGEEPDIVPAMGGSIGNDVFTDILRVPAIWVPHSYSGCFQHAPDEHMLMPVAESALRTMAGLYWDLGEEPARRLLHRETVPSLI